MSWLRLTAGCSMLKIAEQKGVGDQYTAEQFYTLSQLMYVSIIGSVIYHRFYRSAVMELLRLLIILDVKLWLEYFIYDNVFQNLRSDATPQRIDSWAECVVSQVLIWHICVAIHSNKRMCFKKNLRLSVCFILPNFRHCRAQLWLELIALHSCIWENMLE